MKTAITIGLASWVFAFGVVHTDGAEPATNTPAPLPLDLTADFHTNFFAPNYRNAAATFPKGAVKFDGVPFQVVGQAGLFGKTLALRGTVYPERRAGIVVGEKFEELHLVHHAFWSGEDGTVIALVRLNYDDGSTNDFLILYGGHVRDWSRPKYEEQQTPTETNTSRIVWYGETGVTARTGRPLRLFKTTFTNPHPARLVKTLDVISTRSPASYCLIAATVTARDAARRHDPPVRTGAPAYGWFEGTLGVRVLDAESGAALDDVALDAVVADGSGSHPLSVFFTDAKGAKTIRYPRKPITELEFTVRKEGYEDREVTFRYGMFPPDYEVKLTRTVSVGGTVVDEQGQPVEDAKVTVRKTTTLSTVTERTLSLSRSTNTDTQGRWFVNNAPNPATDLSLTVSNADFVTGFFLTEDVPKQYVGTRVESAPLLDRTAKLVLKRGMIFRGVVVDAFGQPVVEAKVRVSTSPIGYGAGNLVAIDSEGRFQSGRFTNEAIYLQVVADGFAPLSRQETLTPDQPPVTMRLEKGRNIRGRVVGRDQQPIAVARVSGSRNSGLPDESWSRETDAQGRFSWDGAPPGEYAVRVVKTGYAEVSHFSLEADGEERTITLMKSTRIKGTVVDAETGQTVTNCMATLGTAWGYGPSGPDYNWLPNQAGGGHDGKFTLESDQAAGSFHVRVEADGYETTVSAPIAPSEQDQEITIRMKKGGTITGTVLLPDGRPASGAQVAMNRGDYVTLSARKLNGSTVATDASGQFTVKLHPEAQTLVVAHPAGFAEAGLAVVRADPRIVLQGWGRIEGTLRPGGRPSPGQGVVLMRSDGGFRSLRFESQEFRAETDAEGRFVLENVPPGEQRLSRMIPMGEGSWTYSHTTPVNVQPGETTYVQLGGEGAQVSGRVSFAGDSKEVDWNSCHATLSTHPETPAGLDTPERRIQWYSSTEYQEGIRNTRTYVVVVGKDGLFRAEDIPPGNYELSIRLTAPHPVNRFMGRNVGNHTSRVNITGQPGAAHDLGTITVPVLPRSTPKTK